MRNKNNRIGRRVFLRIVTVIILVACLGGINSAAVNLQGVDVPGITDIANAGTVPEITAASAVLIDASTGQVLFDKNCHEQRYPASTTKIMTALLAIENLQPDENVVADEEAASMGGSQMFLSAGEEINAQNLLYALMLTSANDAAVALGKAVAGTVPDFVNMMNEKAVACGALNTHFNNTNGLPDEQHYTSAYDLAMITKSAFAHMLFRNIVSTLEYDIPATNQHEARHLYNSNRMLWSTKAVYDINGVMTPAKYEGTNGVKTGYTLDAGSCLVASVNRDGHELIGVVLGSEAEQHYPDMIKIMDYGFNTFDSVVVCKAQDYKYEVKVKKSEERKIMAGIPEDIRLSLPSGAQQGKIETEISLDKKYEAPIKQNQVLGTMNIYYDGNLLCRENIVALSGATLRNGPDWAFIGKVTFVFIIVAILLFIILIAAARISGQKKRRRRRNRRNRNRSFYE